MEMHNLRAITFDLDGTLYPERRIFFPTMRLALRYPRFLYLFSRTRKLIRNVAEIPDFYEVQAEIMAKLIKRSVCQTRQMIERIIYTQWIESMSGMKPFGGIREIIIGLRRKGYKTALLSDMPVPQKTSFLGLDGIWDFAFSSEEANHLKPHPAPFEKLISLLDLKPENIIYIGNNHHYDVIGARAVGMKTAYLGRSRREENLADFHFHNFNQMKHFLLSLEKARFPS